MSLGWGTADVHLERAVEAQFAIAIETYERNLKLLHEHVGHEESIRVGGYSARTLLELVQNAADAASSPSGGRIEVAVVGDALYCANDGAPFNRAGLDALSHAFLSEKRGDEIGRFGLGFKSTLVLSDAPQIFSKSVSFGFGSARANSDLLKIRQTQGPVPVLRTPALLDPIAESEQDSVLADMLEWATTVVKLPALKDYARIEEQVRDFDARFLLFADGIKQIRLRTDSGTDVLIACDRTEPQRASLTDAKGKTTHWVTAHKMHQPSRQAQAEVGKAVARDSIKISLAIPKNPAASETVGELWSYFPLKDRTTATGLFNAPWAINDDRTTLLHNDYNKEILLAMSHLFVDVVRNVSTPTDPARHLDFLTGRGKELRGFADEVLTVNVPIALSQIPCIPDALGVMSAPAALKPLNFGEMAEAQELSNPVVHENWQNSSGTGTNVPHFTCYRSDTRRLRLQILFGLSADTRNIDYTKVATLKSLEPALAIFPSRHVSDWLQEWAAGSLAGAAQALLFTSHLLKGSLKSVARSARIIPTAEGYVGMAQHGSIFLPNPGETPAEFEGSFVSSEFAEIPEVAAYLEKAGFRRLDAVSILRSRLSTLPTDPTPAEWAELWDKMMDVPAKTALDLINKSHRHILVPVRSGDWAAPESTFDVEIDLGERYAHQQFDRTACPLPQLAIQLGVVNQIQSDFPFDREPFGEEYGLWVIDYLNSRKHVDQAELTSIEYSTEPEIGPASMLPIMHETQASPEIRARWTASLMKMKFAEKWEAENPETGEQFQIPSLQSWALTEYGLAKSSLGLVPVKDLVHPSRFDLHAIFPVSIDDCRSLPLPKELSKINPNLLLKYLESPDGANTITKDALLTDLLCAALAHSPNSPRRLPARVGKTVEPQLTENISLVTTVEQVDFVQARHQPYILTSTPEEADQFERLGCVPFDKGFSFSIEYTGRGSEDRALDMFTGLRGKGVDQLLESTVIVRVNTLVKRVEMASGKADDDYDALRDGDTLFVKDELSPAKVMSHLNDLFGLSLTTGELLQAREATQDHKLESLRETALAAQTDEERLETLFSRDEMIEVLPDGLWDSLSAERLVTPYTSVGGLLLQVYGNDAVKALKSKFERLGYTDVPKFWDGTRPAVDWLQRFGFGKRFAGERQVSLDASFVVPKAVQLHPMHDYQENISARLSQVLTQTDSQGRAQKAMLELPTGAGKTRVAAETVLRLVISGELRGHTLWIAQSEELCEQAVQTFSEIWRGLRASEPLTISRLWGMNEVPEPLTDAAVIIATDAKLASIIDRGEDVLEYEWLTNPSAVFIDEGHVAGDSPRYTKILTWLGVDGRHWERPLVGLSATPFKGRSQASTQSLVNRFGSTRISAFEEDSFTPLVERGVLARIKHEILDGMTLSLGADDQQKITNFQRFSSSVLNRVANDRQRLNRLITHIAEQDPSWPILVFTPTILSAQVLAARLNIQHISAAAVSGETGRHERRRTIERFKNGEIRVLTNCDVLTAGFDAPQVKAIYIAKPTLSPNAYIQMVGRGLRGPKNGGKEECLIVDLEDNFDGIQQGKLAFNEFGYLWEERR